MRRARCRLSSWERVSVFSTTMPVGMWRTDVAHADAGLDLVDVLAAGSGRAVGVPLEVGRVDLYLDGVVHERVDEDGGECRLPLALGIERGDAH